METNPRLVPLRSTLHENHGLLNCTVGSLLPLAEVVRRSIQNLGNLFSWTRATTKTTTDGQPSLLGPNSFRTLPPEICNVIYFDVLGFNGWDVHPYRCRHNQVLGPCTALLLVNKQINAETTPMLYGNAVFNVNAGDQLQRFMTRPEHFHLLDHPGWAGSEELYFASRRFIRHLCISFISWKNTEFCHEAGEWSDLAFRGTFSSKSPYKRQNFGVDFTKRHHRAWYDARVVGQNMIDMELKTLTLNVEHAYCPTGCCRYTDGVMATFRYLKRRNKDVVVSLRGAGTLKEVELFAKVFEGWVVGLIEE